MSLEQAASAFDTAIGNSEPRAPSRSENSSKAAPESMFDNLGVMEVDDESPLQGGGDNEDDDSKPVRRAKEPVSEDVEDDEADAADANADADEEDGEADADADADKDEEQDFYEVIIDGEKKEVGLQEALNGYIRQETFHQRLNQLSDVKQAMRTEAQALIEDRKKYISKIDELDKHIELLVPKEPDWDAEYKADPVAARALQKRYDEFNNTRALLRAEKEKVSKEQQERDAQNTAEYTRSENARILSNNPTWKDPKVMQRDLGMMSDTAQKAGFAEEEVLGIRDSRMVTILLKAAKWDKLQGERPKPVRRGAQPVKSGAGSTRTAPKTNTAAKQLERTGSVADAANFFTGVINKRR
jgi:hypothetical protein